MKISVVLITKNEAANIAQCLESVRWADEIIVLDSGSQDQTTEIAKNFTSHIYFHPFGDFASQKNKALSYATGDWVFCIDADEVVTPALAEELKKMAQGPQKKAYSVHRETYFFRQRLRFSGTQNDYPIRFFPRTEARFYQAVHESIQTELPREHLQAILLHHTTRNFKQYQEKLAQYIPLEIESMTLQGRSKSFLRAVFFPCFVFMKLYFLQGGILDGRAGFIFALLSAYYTGVKHFRYWQKS